MTNLELKTRVKARLNWTSSESDALVQDYLNERYRQVVSSVNMARVRFGTVTANTSIGVNTITFTSVAKPLSVYDTVTLKRELEETTTDDIRQRDAAAAATGTPTHYAVLTHTDDEVRLLLYPKPTAVQALSMDALLAGTDMSANADEPAFPVDFHDVLIYGAEADGRLKMEKPALYEKLDAKFEKRLSELRYFLIKSANLNQTPRDRWVTSSSRFRWPSIGA